MASAPAVYSMKFLNYTGFALYFVVYQDYSKRIGSSRIGWKTVEVAAQTGSLPSFNYVSWEMQYGVAIASYDSALRVYSDIQQIDAEAGSTYQVAKLPKSSSLRLAKTEPTSLPLPMPSQIRLENNAAQKLTVGLTLDHNLVTTMELRGGERADFPLLSADCYQVAVYRGGTVKNGCKLPPQDAAEISPVEVTFPLGFTVATLKAVNVGGTYQIQVDPNFSNDQILR